MAVSGSSEGMAQALSDDMGTLKDIVQKLGSEHVSPEYARDIDDLGVLLTSYEESVENVISAFSRDQSYIRELDRISTLYDTTMTDYRWPVYQEVQKANAALSLRLTRWLDLYIVLLIVTLIMLSVYIVFRTREIIRGITSPIQLLTERFARTDFLGSQAEVLPESPEYHEEMNQMIHGYNRMLEKNRRQIQEHEELLQTKLQLQKQEMLNLQRQINPHFLFNTLNMISHTAYLEGDQKVVSLIQTTANLLRYSLDYSSREVTIAQEMEALGYYVSIQEQRFAALCLQRGEAGGMHGDAKTGYCRHGYQYAGDERPGRAGDRPSEEK